MLLKALGRCGEAVEPRLRQRHHSYAHQRAADRAYRFYDENKKASKYWRDIGTLDAFYDANMDLCGVDPEFNLYDPNGRCAPTSRRRRRRSSCSPRAPALRRGARLDHLARLHHLGQPGCRQRALPERSRAQLRLIEQSMLMPGVRVGCGTRIRRAIIDRDVLIPRGALAGFNPEEDRKRHTVTDLRSCRRHRRRRSACRADQRKSAPHRSRRRREITLKIASVQEEKFWILRTRLSKSTSRFKRRVRARCPGV